MLNIYLLIDFTVFFALVILALVVLLQDSRLELNRIFSGFVLSVGIWIASNYISSNIHESPALATTANYFVFAFSFLSAVLILRFTITIASDDEAKKVFEKALIPFSLIVGLCFTPYLVTGVTVQGNVYATKFGLALPVYAIALFSVLFCIFYVIRKNIKISKGVQKSRLEVLYRSFYYTMPLLLITEFILPALTGWFGLTNLGILSMLILVIGLYVGVIKHRLFDLRLIVARSLAYVSSLSVLGFLFISITFFITGFLFHGRNLDVMAIRYIYLVITFALALSFSPLKRFFDRVTNRIFFRDAYDPQIFIDELNKVLVSTFDLEPLLNKSATTIERHIKPQYCAFMVNATEYTAPRNYGSYDSKKYDSKLLQSLNSAKSDLRTPLIVTEALDSTQSNLQSTLKRSDISVTVHLSSKNDESGIGYLLLGPKKSGNVYSSQDLKIIEIVANELIIAIQNALRFEQIEKFNLTLQQKVNDATHKLRKSNEKLKALDETKDDFISMASHQLRTPLTSVKGYISMVLEEDAGAINDTQREMLGQAFFSSQRMVYLIADLLNVSRLKTGKFIIEPKPINLDVIVEQELKQLKESAASRSLMLDFVKPEHFPSMMLDETKTRQIIMNFVDNAIYYTPAGGHITVKLIDKPETIELRVEDNGIGVPKSEIPHLFTKFYRAGNARKARPDGTGLGLFMAKKVIIAQGGSLIFDTVEGKGSTFGFTLSKSMMADAPAGESVAVVAEPVAGAATTKT